MCDIFTLHILLKIKFQVFKLLIIYLIKYFHKLIKQQWMKTNRKKFSFNMNSMDILRFSITVALFNMKSMEILRFSISVALFNMKFMEILRFSLSVELFTMKSI